MRRYYSLVILFLLFLCTALAPVALAQGATYVVQPGDTLGAIAARHGTTVAAIAQANSIVNPNLIYPGQRLALPGPAASESAPNAPPASPPAASATVYPAPFASIRLAPSPAFQGSSVQVNVTLSEPAQVRGQFRDQALRFSQNEDGSWWALIAVGMPRAQAGIGEGTPPGDYTVRLWTLADDGASQQVELTLPVQAVDYTPTPFDPGPAIRPLLDLGLRQAEARRMLAVFSQGTPDRLWQGQFWAPLSTRATGGFMAARTYPDGSLNFHEGVDYATVYGAPVYATAHGVVAVAEPLTVRGNAVYIDHGLGVFSGYFHLSQILVEAGQPVEPGQLIGRVGSTGLSTGPHLHFEIRLNGYNVSPWQWLQTAYPQP